MNQFVLFLNLRKRLLTVCLLISSLLCNAQEEQGPLLFRFIGIPENYLQSEFIRKALETANSQNKDEELIAFNEAYKFYEAHEDEILQNLQIEETKKYYLRTKELKAAKRMSIFSAIAEGVSSAAIGAADAVQANKAARAAAKAEQQMSSAERLAYYQNKNANTSSNLKSTQNQVQSNTFNQTNSEAKQVAAQYRQMAKRTTDAITAEAYMRQADEIERTGVVPKTTNSSNNKETVVRGSTSVNGVMATVTLKVIYNYQGVYPLVSALQVNTPVVQGSNAITTSSWEYHNEIAQLTDTRYDGEMARNYKYKYTYKPTFAQSTITVYF